MKQILLKLTNAIEPIDFRIAAMAGNDNEKLQERHYLYGIVETLQAKAKELGFAFRTKNGLPFLYNGQYWQVLDAEDLRYVLRKSAVKMGVELSKAEFYQFQNSLLNQFYANTVRMDQKLETDLVINLQNGSFVFGPNNELRDFRKEDFITYQLPFKYDPDATCPMFINYLNRVLPDVKCQDILSEYLGYVFMPGHIHQVCLLLYGSGANGKSVLFEIVKALLGKNNMTSYSLKDLDGENCRAMINNKLLNYSSEINAAINKDTFKQLVSGEPIQARFKYKDVFMMENYAKLMFNCNELPKEVEHTNAYFRRFLIIPFNQFIPENERNINLAKDIINEELSGIFNWVLKGLTRLTEQKKFTESETVANALIEFQQEADSVYQFLNEKGFEKCDKPTTRISELYRSYDTFCRDNGYRALHNRNFKKRLELQGIETKRCSAGVYVYVTYPKHGVPAFDDDDLDFPF